MSFFSKQRGVTANMTYDQKRRQQLANVFYILALFACLIDVIEISFLGLKTWVIVLHMAISLIPIGLIYLNKFEKYHILTVDGFLLIVNGWVFFNACIYGPSSGIQYFYFPAFIATFILLPMNKKFRLVFYPLLSITCIIILEATHYSLLLDTSVPSSSIKQKYYIMFFITIVEVILASRYMVKIADSNEKMLEKEKVELARLNVEMDKLNNYIESQNLELKDELHEKSLELLLQQKNLNQALIEGEEKERKRLSRELHDGLGLLLSTAKIKMQTVDSDQLEENRTIIDALELIDKACIELRLISQNLTPTLISEIGIEATLRSLIHSINASKYLKIELISFGVESIKFKGEMEVQLYRIVLELINNCIKHAYANIITVQLISDKNELHIQVEDNGAGIVTSAHHLGQGLKNVEGTVQLYNGKMDIDSRVGRGTTVMIGIPV